MTDKGGCGEVYLYLNPSTSPLRSLRPSRWTCISTNPMLHGTNWTIQLNEYWLFHSTFNRGMHVSYGSRRIRDMEEACPTSRRLLIRTVPLEGGRRGGHHVTRPRPQLRHLTRRFRHRRGSEPRRTLRPRRGKAARTAV